MRIIETETEYNALVDEVERRLVADMPNGTDREAWIRKKTLEMWRSHGSSRVGRMFFLGFSMVIFGTMWGFHNTRRADARYYLDHIYEMLVYITDRSGVDTSMNDLYVHMQHIRTINAPVSPSK